MKTRLRVYDFIIVYGGALFLGAVFSMILQSTMKDGNARIYLNYLIPQILYIGGTFILINAGKREFVLLSKDNVRAVHYPVAVLVAFGMFFAALLPNYGIMKLLVFLGKEPSVTVPVLNGFWDYFLSTALICILAPIGEELLFRKLFCDCTETSEIKKVLLGGLVFSLTHMNLAQTVHQFFIGSILCFIYIRTKNITLTVVMHIINNILAFYLESITGAEFWNNLTVLGVSFALGIIAAVAGILYFIKFVHRNGAERDIIVQTREKYWMAGLVGVLAVLWLITVLVV